MPVDLRSFQFPLHQVFRLVDLDIRIRRSFGTVKLSLYLDSGAVAHFQSAFPRRTCRHRNR